MEQEPAGGSGKERRHVRVRSELATAVAAGCLSPRGPSQESQIVPQKCLPGTLPSRVEDFPVELQPPPSQAVPLGLGWGPRQCLLWIRRAPGQERGRPERGQWGGG